MTTLKYTLVTNGELCHHSSAG